jgi:hypothetical protein
MGDERLDLDRLPTVARLGTDLAAAFSAKEAEATATVTARTRGSSRRRVATATAVVCAVAGGIALAQSVGRGIPISPQEWLAGKRAIPETRIVAAQSRHLAILRRSRTDGDRVDASDAAVLSHSSLTGASGANFSLSRRVRGLANGAAWIVPAAGSVCIVADEELAPSGAPIRGSNGAAGCEPDGEIIASRLIVSSSTARRSRDTLVAGIVPDGVQTLQARLPSGEVVDIRVHENVYIATLRGRAVLSFNGPSGHESLEPVETINELERHR